MNFFNHIYAPLEPDFKFLQPNAIRHHPHSVELASQWKTYGSSSGWGDELVAPAFGEFMERKHFYLEVQPERTGRLSEVLHPLEVEAFADALLQTSSVGRRDSILSHVFSMSSVIRLADLERCYIPTVLVSLTTGERPEDDQFYPVRDTCGCSAHHTVKSAVYGAMKESLERQFLLRFWLTKSYQQNVELESALAMLEGRPEKALLSELSTAGEIRILDISDYAFPGQCVFLCFGSITANNGIRYCAGMAYAEDFGLALRKSIVEFWQTYRFMYSFYANRRGICELEDSYLKHFFSCNSYETFQTIIQFRSVGRPVEASGLNAGSLLRAVNAQSLNGYLYIRQLASEPQPLYACKYISPAGFLHMNNARGFNVKNTYSASFSNEIAVEQLERMVPFP